jgi:anti-sigma factor RsiW
MDSDKTNDLQESLPGTDATLLEQAEGLIWALLDDEIRPPDIKRLEAWMQQHEQVRERYIACVQMHVDLHGHFGKAPAPIATNQPMTDQPMQSPVLTSLNDSRPSSGSWPPVAE